jgi:hypothetical protein
MKNNNVAFGYQALYHNTTGSQNTALGYQALYKAAREPEPLTDWYKAAVKAKGLDPHTKEEDGSKT